MSRYILKVKLLKIRNDLYRIINKRNFTNKIVMFTSKKYLYRVCEDVMVEYYLMKIGVNAKIKSWEDYQGSDSYGLVKSTWGYQYNEEKFTSFINSFKGRLINDKKTIFDNINKRNQYEMMIKNNIPCIETNFVDSYSELMKALTKENKVVKPVVGASSYKTFLVNLNNVEKLEKEFVEVIDKGMMVQPFIKEIEGGETSVIIVNKKVSHVLKRFPGVFTNKQALIPCDSDNDIENIVNKVVSIKEFNGFVIRLDLVKIDNKYHVMEIEVIEPQLFFESFANKKELYKNYVEEIKNYMD